MKINIYLIITFLVLIISVENVRAQQSTLYPTYEIQPGDSLGYISQLFGTTVDELVRVNSLSNPDVLNPGQTLKIPGLEGVTGTLKFIIANPGEDLSDIITRYQLDTDQFIQLNQIITPEQIYLGSKYLIALPFDREQLIPVQILTENNSLLELSAVLEINPWKLVLQNNEQDNAHLLVYTALFASDQLGLKEVDLFAPLLEKVTLSPLPLIQGETIEIKVNGLKIAAISGKLADQELIFLSEVPGEYISLQGIHALAQPGLVELTLSGSLIDGSTFEYSQKILLEPGNFDEDPPLIVDPATVDPVITKPENEYIFSKTAPTTLDRYWNGIFQSPAVYQEYNSLFGTRRVYNDDPTVYFHTGVDFGGGITLPVYAPAAGTVIVAEELTVRGNTIYIDHGWGVYSGFFHQEKILVEEGDIVTQGQQIGTVGNTGRVNGADDYYGAGAHLHWELWVHGIQVNPLTWLYTKFP